jgi:hypothetical protein
MYLLVQNFYIYISFGLFTLNANIFISISFRIYILPLKPHTTGPALNLWEIPVLADLS